MARSKPGTDPDEILFRLMRSGLTSETTLFKLEEENQGSNNRKGQLKKVIRFISKPIHMKPGNILALIMYDIEDHRVRKYIADYLERKSYVRIQKSIFFGNVSRKAHEQVYEALKKINGKYKNGDSILFLPVGTDNISNLKLVGKNINFETMVNKPNTLFF